jgi:hypothetical protein
MNQLLLLLLRLVQERNFCLLLLVLAYDIINEENIIKVCMLVWVLAPVIMLVVIWVVIMDIIIHTVNREKFSNYGT